MLRPAVLIWLLAAAAADVSAADPAPSGDAVIRAPCGESEIVITTTSRLAGAIHSLTWGGKEFIDSADHGRQLQSAGSFFDGRGTFVPETYNPTEAGSRRDGAGPTSTSRLLALSAEGNRLTTTVQMAFWLAPGERSAGEPARNAAALSEHRVTKEVEVGALGLPHAIRYDVTFDVPDGERHALAQFEAVTGYLPAEFRRFWRYEAATKRLVELDDGPGEQADPVVLATDDGAHAMGVYSPDQPSPGFAHAGYGRFRFEAEGVVKWNCVFRVRDPAGVRTGAHRFRTFVLVGTREDVRAALEALHAEFAAR